MVTISILANTVRPSVHSQIRWYHPSGQEHSHGKTQYIRGKQVLARSWLWKIYFIMITETGFSFVILKQGFGRRLLDPARHINPSSWYLPQRIVPNFFSWSPKHYPFPKKVASLIQATVPLFVIGSKAKVINCLTYLWKLSINDVGLKIPENRADLAFLT